MTSAPLQLQAVFFDWAGTTIDYGSRAPTQVFQEIFRRREVEVTAAEARGPMGMAKRAHIAAVASLPRVSAAWKARYGTLPGEADVDRMYEEFLPLQKEILAAGSEVIPGVPEAVAECRRQGLKIGSSTGYTYDLMSVVAPIAEKGGYKPDVIVCPDEVRDGRPAPWLNFRIAEKLNVFPMSTVVIVDDTPIGIAAGRNAGTWTVAVTKTGNTVGLSEAEVRALSPQELQDRLDAAAKQFGEAHFVIPGVADLPPILKLINDRLRNGETPA